MSTRSNAAPVARGEFNRALALVWTFIMLAFANLMFGSHQSVSWPNGIYLMVSLAMVVYYAIASLRGDRTRNGALAGTIVAILAIAAGAVAFLVGNR